MRQLPWLTADARLSQSGFMPVAFPGTQSPWQAQQAWGVQGAAHNQSWGTQMTAMNAHTLGRESTTSGGGDDHTYEAPPDELPAEGLDESRFD